jgi:hypothetical protein
MSTSPLERGDAGPDDVNVDFAAGPGSEWQRHTLTGSAIEAAGGRWRFINHPSDGSAYTNAQIDDYSDRSRRHFLWGPPLTLTVRARFSHPAGALQGTAGFGFWNDPFLMTGLRPPALPRAVWFFYSSPQSNMKLARDVPGHGWKAATIDAIRAPFLLLAPTAPLAVPLMNIRPVYHALWPVWQRALNVGEAPVDGDMTAWRTYKLAWGSDRVVFSVDGHTVLDCAPPRDPAAPLSGSPLGFVMWIDNQSLVATPWGRFRWRSLPVPHEQWLEVEALRITRRAPGEGSHA